jgi:hypothetical protein
LCSASFGTGGVRAHWMPVHGHGWLATGIRPSTPSARMAMDAPTERLAYVALLNPTGDGRPDALGVLDVDPGFRRRGVHRHPRRGVRRSDSGRQPAMAVDRHPVRSHAAGSERGRAQSSPRTSPTHLSGSWSRGPRAGNGSRRLVMGDTSSSPAPFHSPATAVAPPARRARRPRPRNGCRAPVRGR